MTIKWQTMRHSGVAFPPPYEPRGLHVNIARRPVKLEPLQEEMLIAWAKKLGTPYVQDEVFQKNFLASLAERWPELFGKIELAEIDFRELEAITSQEKLSNLPEERRKAISAERKNTREELKARFGAAVVDGQEVEIGAYLVEPPGIFMGRGAHPKRGQWKRRVFPEDVELNLDEQAPVPDPLYGGDWKGILHDHNGLWVARWKDELSDKLKYVWLAETSQLRQEREREKFEKAGKLETGLERVRSRIRKGMNSKNETERQAATVAYLIDKLAMRVGDEKDEDEADTVGASTLRCEHVRILENRIDFDFLGKDSVRWEKSLPNSGPDRILAARLREFMQDKEPEEQIFPTITSSRVNAFLRSAMRGLTAKVFRTFYATNTVKDYLTQRVDLVQASSLAEKEYTAKMANLQAAIRCNHKRTPPKSWEQTLRNKEQALQALRAQEPKTEKQRARLEERIIKAQRSLDLARATRDYNLNTSLKNYIDPRVFKAWGEAVDYDWTMLYTKALQRKFSWARQSRLKWETLAGKSSRNGHGLAGEPQVETESTPQPAPAPSSGAQP